MARKEHGEDITDVQNVHIQYQPEMGINGMFALCFKSYEQAKFFAEGLSQEIELFKGKKGKKLPRIEECALITFTPDRPMPGKKSWRWKKGISAYAVVSDFGA